MDNMKGKIAWMDSMDFDHELGIAPETELFASEQSCRKRKTCIAKCEASPDPTGYNCRPQRVIVFDADEYEANEGLGESQVEGRSPIVVLGAVTPESEQNL